MKGRQPRKWKFARNKVHLIKFRIKRNNYEHDNVNENKYHILHSRVLFSAFQNDYKETKDIETM